ncbi:MAG: HNH endonuclease [Lachnospiraceae bacterium]|nr:HNH endonuclease [Lachnospiraceae bacterium]
MKEIKISQGHVALVDDEDYERLSQYSWQWDEHGAGYAGRHIRRNGKCVHIIMHREIMNAPEGVQIDHINGNGLDNRKSNLRFANVQKNSFNRKKPAVKCTSVFKGVLQRKGVDYWLARIKYNDKHVELGRFRTQEEAAAAYNFASEIFFGEYRRENVSELIPDLSDEMREIIFQRCEKKIRTEAWIINTKGFIKYSQIYDSTDKGRVFSWEEG